MGEKEKKEEEKDAHSLAILKVGTVRILDRTAELDADDGGGARRKGVLALTCRGVEMSESG